MNYINQFKLIHNLVQNKPFNSKELLATVDIQAIILALQKTKEGVPRPFQYTSEPMEEENLSRIPQKDKEHLWKIYDDLPENPEKVLPQLLELRERFPQVPCIYNYLASTYAYLKQDQQHLSIIEETIHRFPGYLFGKISLADYYINHNDHKKVPEILSRKFDIYQHYPPNIEVFHISEVRSFYTVVGRYYARSNKIARALFCYFMLEDIDKGHRVVRLLGDEIILKEVEKLKNNLSKKAPKKRR